MSARARWGFGLAAVALLAAACSREPGDPIPYDAGMTEPAPVDAGADGDGDAGDVGIAQCATVVEQHPNEGASHIPCTSPADYQTVPPSSGNHYPVWAAYGVYDVPIRWGHLVHNLEHGAVVIVYNCPDGCADDLARATALVNSHPLDPACSQPRLILAPDPTLPVKWAASAWTWTLNADCFADAIFTKFVSDHLGDGPEAICSGYPLNQLCTTP